MKKVLIAVAISDVWSCVLDHTGGGGGHPFVAGCYDSTTSSDSLIYNGQIGTYKNAQFAINNGSCAPDPVNDYVTVVTAGDKASALAACQAGPDPAADDAAVLYSLGFTSLPTSAWYCTNPLSGMLLQPGDCYAIGSASVQYLGPRDTLNNATLYSGSTTCGILPAPAPTWTYVQRSTQPEALLACASIVGGTFTTANSLAAVFPSMPNDAYFCYN